MATPPSAGPAIAPTLPRTAASAAADGRSSRSTRRGVIASRAGRWNPLMAEISPLSTNTSETLGCGANAFRDRPRDASVNSSSAPISNRRRSMASAYAPPHSPNSSSGTSCTVPSRPTIRLDWVSAYTWYGTATYVIMLPNTETNCPMNSSRKSRFRRRGPRSMNIRGRRTLAARPPTARKKNVTAGTWGAIAPRSCTDLLPTGLPAPLAGFATGRLQGARLGRVRGGGAAGTQRQHAVAAGGEEQKQEAVDDRQLALVDGGQPHPTTKHQLPVELRVSHGHLAGGQKGDRAGQYAQRDQRTAHQLDDAPHPKLRPDLRRELAQHPQHLLGAMKGEQRPSDKPKDDKEKGHTARRQQP